MNSILALAAFDFDGTITTKNTLLEFIKFSRGKCRFYFGFLMFSPLLAAMKLKLYPNWKVKQLIFSWYFKGVSLEKFNEWGKAFSPEIEKILRHQTIERLDFHRKSGDKIIIVSASVENWIKPWAIKNDIETVLATKIETDHNGLLTGRFSTKNCYGKEKVNRLLGVFPDRKSFKLTAYGDSRGDKELIDFADIGFCNKLD
ncbi:MAG TPA: HAD-IB family hydrolase [Bacteroidales bacterium]|nr:HAD-IB family hydrolase [Bacteroidales bacterium]